MREEACILGKVLAPNQNEITAMAVLKGGDFDGGRELGFEEWRTVVRSIAGRDNPELVDPNDSAGRMQVGSLFGLCADQFYHNADRIERTQRDVRLDDVEFYHAVFQVVGSSTIRPSLWILGMSR